MVMLTILNNIETYLSLSGYVKQDITKEATEAQRYHHLRCLFEFYYKYTDSTTYIYIWSYPKQVIIYWSINTDCSYNCGDKEERFFRDLVYSTDSFKVEGGMPFHADFRKSL